MTIDQLNDATGHDCDAAFSWWDGSRRNISCEPHEVADAIVLWTGTSRRAALATAHILPIMTDPLEAPAVARTIRDWLALETNGSGFARQTAFKEELRSMIRAGGHDREADADLYEGIDRAKITLTTGHYAVDLSLEMRDGERLLCIVARNDIAHWDLGTIAELLLSEGGQDEETPVEPSPEPIYA